MLKAFTPVAVLIFSYFAGLEKTSAMELYIVFIICVGVAITSAGETYFSWVGFIFQVWRVYCWYTLARIMALCEILFYCTFLLVILFQLFVQSLGILAESSRLVLTNILMKNLKLDPLSSLYYIAPLCATFIGVACLIFEGT